MGRGTSISLTKTAVALGGMKNVRQCRPLVRWATERLTDGVILDIGAHFGAFCVMLLQQCPALTCHAFEPNPVAVDALSVMARRNRIKDRVIIHQMALSDQNGIATLRVPQAGKFSGLATLGEPHRFKDGLAFRVEVQILDGWAEGQGLPKIRLVKIDVEGAELLVLRGGERTIAEHHPLLVLERQQKNAHQFGIKVEQVEELVTSWGYKCERKGRDLLCEWPS